MAAVFANFLDSVIPEDMGSSLPPATTPKKEVPPLKLPEIEAVQQKPTKRPAVKREHKHKLPKLKMPPAVEKPVAVPSAGADEGCGQRGGNFGQSHFSYTLITFEKVIICYT